MPLARTTLGLAAAGAEEDAALAAAWWGFLDASAMPFEQAFFDWRGGLDGAARAARSPAAGHCDSPAFAPVRAAFAGRQPADGVRLDHPYFARPQSCTMLIEEVEALWAPIAKRDDWSAFHAKLAGIEEMRDACCSLSLRERAGVRGS